MEGGRIVTQGRPEQVAAAWPELERARNRPDDEDDDDEDTGEDEQRAGPSSSDRAKQRWNLLRLVTHTGYVFNSVTRAPRWRMGNSAVLALSCGTKKNCVQPTRLQETTRLYFRTYCVCSLY